MLNDLEKTQKKPIGKAVTGLCRDHGQYLRPRGALRGAGSHGGNGGTRDARGVAGNALGHGMPWDAMGIFYLFEVGHSGSCSNWLMSSPNLFHINYIYITLYHYHCIKLYPLVI